MTTIASTDWNKTNPAEMPDEVLFAEFNRIGESAVDIIAYGTPTEIDRVLDRASDLLKEMKKRKLV